LWLSLSYFYDLAFLGVMAMLMAMTERLDLIDIETLRRQRDRAAAGFDRLDYLKRAVAERIMDRIDTIRRDLPLVLDVGCHTGVLTEMLKATPKIGTVKALDPAAEMVARAHMRTGVEVAQADFDQMFCADMPFFNDRFDAIVSAFSLHWANDLPGVLVQLKQWLKPDGVMLLALAGGDTLNRLRNCIAMAESEIMGGLSPRVLPMGDIRDMGGLIGRAGLVMPVADSDKITVTYPDFLTFLGEIRGMGEGNALAGRIRRFSPRALFLRAAELYQDEYAAEDGCITESFDIITLTGWSSGANQPEPLKPGSAKKSLADALGTQEHGHPNPKTSTKKQSPKK
jgi:SAM-dependent methyltransferase